MKSKHEPITDAVRQLLAESGLTEYAICEQAGVDKATMSRFRNRQSGLTLQTLDRLAEHLGWELVAIKKSPRGKKKRSI